MAKTALVTGAAGFTGSHAVELLCERGWDVTATDLKQEGHDKYYCKKGIFHPVQYLDLVKGMDVRFISSDLTDKESLRPLFDRHYDAVFHTASLYDYFALWDVLYKVNVVGARNLGELAAENEVGRMVHWSTDGVYGEIHDGPGDETVPLNPPNLYSKSKAEQEKVLWALREKKGLKLTVVRPAPIYGPRHRYGTYHILYIIRKMGTGVSLAWYPKKHTLMFPSAHVKDLVRAALFLAELDRAEGEAYNVLSDCVSQTEMMEFLYEALGVPYVRLPVWWPLYKLAAALALHRSKSLDRAARKKGLRPKIDVPMVEYITHQYWFSNQKLKDAGYEFLYEDPRKGMWDYIGWCKEEGWL